MFGSARVKPGHAYYELGRELGKLITEAGYATITGGEVSENTATAEGGGLWNGFGTMQPYNHRVRSTVGAGDSSLAGFLLAESAGASPEECLRSGIRYGSAAAALPGTQAPTPADLLPGDVPVRALAP